MCSYIYWSNNCRTTPAKQDKLLHCGTCSSIYCCISNGFCSLEQFCWWLPFSAALFGESIQLACEQTTEDIANRWYICIYSELSAALSAQPPQPIPNTCCDPRNNTRQDFILGIVKNTSAQTLGNSIWEILVNFPLFSPLSQNGSFLEPELQMCSVSGKHFWVLLPYKF